MESSIKTKNNLSGFTGLELSMMKAAKMSDNIEVNKATFAYIENILFL